MIQLLKKHFLCIILFIFTAIGIHTYFIIANGYYAPIGADASKQFLYFKYFLHRLFSNGEFLWSWKYGLGGDIWGQFNYYYSSSVFFWLTMLFRIDDLHDVLNLQLPFSMVKTFLAMLFTYIHLRFRKRSTTASILGGLIYGGTVFFSLYSLRVDYMAEAFIWLPLMLLGYDRYLKNGKFGLFVFSVFLVVVTNFYFAFVSSVFINIYAWFRYFLDSRNYSIKNFILYYFRMVKFYLLGFGLAAFSFLPAVYSFLHADRFDKDYEIPLLFDLSHYKSVFYSLFYSIEFPVTSMTNYTIVLPIGAFILLILGLTVKKRETRFHFGLFFIMFLLYLIPFTYSFFNGLSAMQPRWLYLFIYTIVLSVAFTFDELKDNRRTVRQSLLMIGSIVGLVALLFFKNELSSNVVRINDIAVTLLGITIALLFLLKKKRLLSISLIGLFIINILLVNYQFFSTHLGPYQELKQTQEEYFTSSGFDHESEKEIVQRINERDQGFYRMIWLNSMEYNTPMLYGYNGFSTYQSLIPENVHQFIRNDHNVLQFDSPSLYKDLDNRVYLETALANKYYIVPDGSQFQPYGYAPIHKMNGYTIYENEYFLPIGYVVDQYITEDEFEHLSPSEKDQMLLHGVVLDDSVGNELLDHFDRNTLNSQLLHQGFDGVNYHGIERKGNVFQALEDDAYIDIKIDKPKEPGEVLVEVKISSLEGEDFKINVNGKVLNKRPNDYTYSYPKEEFLFKINREMINENVHVKLSKGTYQIEELRVYFNSLAKYEHSVKDLRSKALNVTDFSERKLAGKVSADQPGMLFLSVPYSEGWKVKVDDQDTAFYQANHGFIGVPLSEGEHHILLEYVTPWLKVGIIISVLSMLVFCVYFFRGRGQIDQ